MNFHNSKSRLFVAKKPNKSPDFERTTHLGIGAHQDDIEFMAMSGILECIHSDHHWFGGVTCTDGAGSVKAGKYKNTPSEKLQKIRAEEQEKAARIGQYSFMAQLGYSSHDIKDSKNTDCVGDLKEIITASKPEIIYTHNPADKHPSHVAVFSKVIKALREIDSSLHPKKVLGCEVWRGLDWMNDDEKVALDLSGHDELVSSLIGLFDSQISGGKRYDLAVEGRKLANATFYDSHKADDSDKIWFAMDLTPLIKNIHLEIEGFVLEKIDIFRKSVSDSLNEYGSS